VNTPWSALKKEGYAMPFVNIKITKEGATPQKKDEIIKGVTQLLADVLGKNPQRTVVVIDEYDTDNWGFGGESITASRKRETIVSQKDPKTY
jgi:4-oxalocrotonate tautomerase